MTRIPPAADRAEQRVCVMAISLSRCSTLHVLLSANAKPVAGSAHGACPLLPDRQHTALCVRSGTGAERGIDPAVGVTPFGRKGHRPPGPRPTDMSAADTWPSVRPLPRMKNRKNPSGEADRAHRLGNLLPATPVRPPGVRGTTPRGSVGYRPPFPMTTKRTYQQSNRHDDP